ncbi:hypothetical protein CH063_11275 [Colletotrichum higginsianum]|uniref:Uncharacterized protein n=1 Tax=Colletotrichum higginsianum (strain IMI 349063) TaxID=759273 RepID=H1VKP6_COLHI|nr:hypothetical protein CH063_11275 [Colletotrichum higginsianum]
MSQHPEPATALTKGFTNHLRAREQERRRKTWTKCPICGDELRAESRDDVQQHYKDNHAAGQDSNPPPTAQNLSDQIDEDSITSTAATSRPTTVIRSNPIGNAVQRRPWPQYPDPGARKTTNTESTVFFKDTL